MMTKNIKKFIAFAVIGALFISSVFADEEEKKEKKNNQGQGERLIEFRLNFPFSISNNTLMLTDYLVEDLVFDLGEFADKMPSEGFVVNTQTDPSINLKAQIPNGPSVGVDLGLNLYTRLGLSKDVFNFIGHGNGDEEFNLTESLDGFGDVFGYVKANVGWDFNKFSVVVSPSLFTTVVHLRTNNAYVNAYNRDDGTFGFLVNGNFEAYSVIPVNESIKSSEYWQNFNSYTPELWKALGFDIAGSVEVPIFDWLKVTGSARVPLIPSHLTNKTELTVTASQETSVNEIAAGKTESPAYDFQVGETQDTSYYINRPLKLYGQGDFSFLADMINLSAGVGIGVEHPFAKDKAEMGFYFDYLLGVKANFFGMMFAGFQHDYTDKIFNNTIYCGANLKFFEIDLGAKFTSSYFTSSFKGDGLGLYTSIAFGF